MSHKSSGASLGEKKPKSFCRPLYALVDVTMGDTLNALITCSPCCKFLVDASAMMHREHPEHHDFAVFRSTDLGYFGSKVTPVAFNGELFHK